MARVKVGLYGANGHQVQNSLVDHADAELAAVAGFGDKETGVPCRRYDTLHQLLSDGEVELVSLCSPLRSEQAQHAIQCMRAGKHVYAEKPCAMDEADLDAIIATAHETGMQFHEMAGTVVQRPYATLRAVVADGRIGEVVQVLAQKSYPWGDWRPANEDIDGGLAMQVGIYVARFVEHIAGTELAAFDVSDTAFGNPRGDACRMAASISGTLRNGGLVSAVCNYLNTMGDRVWGYEILRIFGTEGIVESNAESGQTRLLRKDSPPQYLDTSTPSADYFDLFVGALQGRNAMPLPLDKELSPTRWVIRARNRARAESS